MRITGKIVDDVQELEKGNEELDIDEKEILNWIDSKPQRLRRKLKYTLRFIIMIPLMPFLLIFALIRAAIRRG